MVGTKAEICNILLVLQSQQTAQMEMEGFAVILFGNCLRKFWSICVLN